MPKGKPQTLLSKADLKEVCDLVYEKAGMVFGESKRYYVERRVTDRMLASGALGPREYIAYLRANGREAELLINCFTVNETYFYREEHQFACLVQSILPRIVETKRPGDRVRIWSMPCSTGEEPYSIALWLLENWPLVDAYNIEIVGSDIDTEVLRRAAEGMYGSRSLGRLNAQLLDTYFHPVQHGEWELIEDIRQSVTLTSANIVDRRTLADHRNFDVIFCRNLLIYFDEKARALAAENIHYCLSPGGYVCLGHTKSMMRISDNFEAIRFPDAIVYKGL